MEKIRMTLRLVKNLNDRLNIMSKKLGRSKNDLIVTACWELVEEMNYQEKHPTKASD